MWVGRGGDGWPSLILLSTKSKSSDFRAEDFWFGLKAWQLFSESENKYYECFGDWWEHQVNFITRGSGLENGTSSDLKLGCGHSGSVILSVDGQSIPDKNNLGNGELKQEPSHNTTYFIELKGEAEMSKVGLNQANLKML